MRISVVGLVGLVGLGACGSKGSAPISNSGAAPRKATPCPDDHAVDALARVSWGAGDTPINVAMCVPVLRHGTSYWWIKGEVQLTDLEGGTYPPFSSLVTDRGDVIWKQSDGIGLYRYTYESGHARDFDGDGEDEIFFEQTYGEGSVSATELVVVVPEPKPVIMLVELGQTSDGGDKECRGTWKLHGPAVIEVTREGDCDGVSVHELFRRRGNELVSLEPSRWPK